MGGNRKQIRRSAAGEACQRTRNKPKKVDVRDWAGTLDYLLEDVLGRLPLADCFALTSVCKPWRSVVSKYLEGCDRRIPCFVKRKHTEVAVRSCFNVLENSPFEMELPEAYGSYIFGSFQDWLFLGRYKSSMLDISLLNPFSGEMILLPRTSHNYYLIALSAVPNDDDCIFLIVSKMQIAFWTPNARQWHTVNMSSFEPLEIFFYGGCFYLMYEYDKIIVVSEKYIRSLKDCEKGAGATVLPRTLFVKLPNHPNSDCASHYLVESHGNILLVSRFFTFNYARIDETSAFEVYKLDLHKLAWLKLENLDDQIIFVGSCCSRSFGSKDLGDAFANDVYFINDAHWIGVNEWEVMYRILPMRNDNDDWGVFHTQKPGHWPSIFRDKPKRWAGIWLNAPIWWCLKQRSRTFKLP